MNMKKFNKIPLLCSLALVLLAGCGSDKTTGYVCKADTGATSYARYEFVLDDKGNVKELAFIKEVDKEFLEKYDTKNIGLDQLYLNYAGSFQDEFIDYYYSGDGENQNLSWYNVSYNFSDDAYTSSIKHVIYPQDETFDYKIAEEFVTSFGFNHFWNEDEIEFQYDEEKVKTVLKDVINQENPACSTYELEENE